MILSKLICNDSNCTQCDAKAELLSCIYCGAEGNVTNCGHKWQPRPIAGDKHGFPVCETCDQERQAT